MWTDAYPGDAWAGGGAPIDLYPLHSIGGMGCVGYEGMGGSSLMWRVDFKKMPTCNGAVAYFLHISCQIEGSIIPHVTSQWLILGKGVRGWGTGQLPTLDTGSKMIVSSN